MKNFFPLFVFLYFKRKSCCADFFFLNYKVDHYICNCVRVSESGARSEAKSCVPEQVMDDVLDNVFPKSIGSNDANFKWCYTIWWSCISSNLLTSFKERSMLWRLNSFLFSLVRICLCTGSLCKQQCLLKSLELAAR